MGCGLVVACLVVGGLWVGYGWMVGRLWLACGLVVVPTAHPEHPVCLQMGVAFVCILNRDSLLPRILIFVRWARPFVVVLSPGRSGKLRAF